MAKVIFKKLDIQDPEERKSFLHTRKLAIQEHQHTNFLRGSATYKKKDMKKKNVFVLKEKNEVIGMIFYSRGETEKTSHKFTFSNLYVLSSQQGGGYGRLLLTEMERYISRHFALPVIKINLQATEGNTKAIKLYKKLGFTTIGLDPMRVRDGKRYFGLYLMTKIIENK